MTVFQTPVNDDPGQDAVKNAKVYIDRLASQGTLNKPHATTGQDGTVEFTYRSPTRRNLTVKTDVNGYASMGFRYSPLLYPSNTR